jgi:predicted acyltransferase
VSKTRNVFFPKVALTVGKALTTNLGSNVFKLFGDAYEPFVHGAAVLLVLWLLLFWMYRRKIFLRI